MAAQKKLSTFKDLYKNVKEGNELLLSDALIKLRVDNVNAKKIYTTVIRGGKLKTLPRS